MRDQPGMAKGAGNVGLLAIGILVLYLPALHRGDEVLEDVFGLKGFGGGEIFSIEILDLDLAAGVREDESAFTGNNDRNTAHVGKLVRVVHVLTPVVFLELLRLGKSACLEDEGSGIVVMINDLSVRRLTIIVVAEAATDTHGPGRDPVLA